MKILIIDDEHLARLRLKDLILQIKPEADIHEASNAEEAIESYESMEPDLVMVDIRMPGISGIELAYHFSSMEKPPAIIFTTAYSEYALDAFEADAIDYLMKPIRLKRLKHAFDKLQPISKTQSKALKERSNRTHIAVRQRDRIKLVPIADICYFRSEDKYVAVITKDDRYLINATLNKLEGELGRDFLRVHRNSLISIKHLDGLEKLDEKTWCAVLKGTKDKVEISRRQKPVIRGWLKNRG